MTTVSSEPREIQSGKYGRIGVVDSTVQFHDYRMPLAYSSCDILAVKRKDFKPVLEMAFKNLVIVSREDDPRIERGDHIVDRVLLKYRFGRVTSINPLGYLVPKVVK